MFHHFFFLLEIVAPVFAVMVVGYAMRKFRVLSAEADQSMTRVVVVLLAPCLALDSIIGNESLTKPVNWLLPPLLGFLSIVLGIVCARLGARLAGFPPGVARRTFIFTTSIQNYGYIALPLCLALFSRETMGVLFAFCLGVEIAFWTIALWQLTGRSAKQPWWRAINPMMVAIPVAFILNALGAKAWLPGSLTTTVHMLGICAVPVALLVSGALIADHFKADALRAGGRTILVSSVIRIGVLPLLILAVAWALPVGQELKAVLILEAAMPAAIFPIVLTKAHNGDVPVALQVVIGTSLIGLVSIPLWLNFGMHWVLGGAIAILP
jgi:malate permease and related proteins